ncbi:histidine kinase [Nostoc sp.]
MRGREQGDKGDNEKLHTVSLFPIPHTPCPMPHAQFPIPNLNTSFLRTQ